MDETRKLTRVEQLAFLGHQARERELQRAAEALAAEFRELAAAIGDRLGIEPEAIGREYVLDVRDWELKPAPAPRADPEQSA